MNNAIEKIENLTYGVEIECEGITQRRAVKAVEAATGGRGVYVGCHLSNYEVRLPDGRKWQVVTDGSLRGGAEVVTPICTYKDTETVQAVLRELKRAGANWNSRTGLHIHVGAADMTPKQIANLVKIFYKQEELILKAAGTQPSRLGWYTRKTDHTFLDKMTAIKEPTMENLADAYYHGASDRHAHYCNCRYRAMNLHNLGNGNKHTVEFRFFEGTGHAGILRANILLALTIVAFAKEAKAASAKKPRTYNEATAKYDFRVFMLRLGWIGDEFKNPRKHLLKNLPGDTAFRTGRNAARNAA